MKVFIIKTGIVSLFLMLLATCKDNDDSFNYNKDEVLNVLEFGADKTGETDNTILLQDIHKYGHKENKKVYYPNGTYLFNDDSLDLSSGVLFESKKGVLLRNNISNINLFQHDDFGNFIGFIQNATEKGEKELNGEAFCSGYLMEPPIFDEHYERRVDFIGWWYNDFGLDCIRTQQTGWIGWYYWTWNHHDCLTESIPGKISDPYDPARHPLLGFYKGDDPVVLDWQCFWMLKYGVNVTGLLSSFNKQTFSFSGHDQWIYELLTNTPNFKKMKYFMCPEVSYPSVVGVEENYKKHKSYIMDMINQTYGQHQDNIYTIHHNDNDYPVIAFIQEGAVLWTYDNPNKNPVPANTIQLYKDIADKFKTLGYPGVVIIAGIDPINYFDTHPDCLSQYDIIRFTGSYGRRYTWGENYSEIVANFKPPKTNKNLIMPVATALKTHSPHESNWEIEGNTPELFKKYIKKALGYIEEYDTYPAISCYNVSEWAEGGPGLIPNMQDRFSYLQAIKDMVIVQE